VLHGGLQQYSPAAQVVLPQTTGPSCAASVPPQPVFVEKQLPFGQVQVATVWLEVGEQPQAPVMHESGKSAALVQHSPELICPPVEVHRVARADASELT
jgi:hypothetical protein